MEDWFVRILLNAHSCYSNLDHDNNTCSLVIHASILSISTCTIMKCALHGIT